MDNSVTTRLGIMGACKEALKWAAPFGEDAARAWWSLAHDTSVQPDKRVNWMLWFLERSDADPATLLGIIEKFSAAHDQRSEQAHTYAASVITGLADASDNSMRYARRCACWAAVRATIETDQSIAALMRYIVDTVTPDQAAALVINPHPWEV